METLFLTLFLFLNFTSLMLYGAVDILVTSSFQKEDTSPTPELMGFFNNSSLTTAVRGLFKAGSKNLFSQSPSTAKDFVTPVLESSGMPYKFRALRSEAPCPSSALATLQIGSRPQLPSTTASAVPTACSLQPIASIRSVSRIGTSNNIRRAFTTLPPTQGDGSCDSASSIQGVPKVENSTAISVESEKANVSFAYNRWRKASKAGEVARAAAVFAINSTSA